MSDEQISLLERYLLESDKEKFFSTLVKNSETYINMRLLDHINRFGLAVPDDTKAELKSYLSNSANQKTFVYFKHRILEIQTEKDAGKRKTLIQDFDKKFLSTEFSFSRPANIKQSDHLFSATEVKTASKVDIDSLSFDKAVENFFNQSDWAQIKNFRPQYYYRFDMKRLLDKKLECFEHVLNSLTCFAHIPDAAKLLSKLLNEKRKQNKGYALNSNYFNKMTLKQLEELQSAVPDVINDRNFVSIYFQKAFEVELLTLPTSEELSTEDYRAILVKMYDWVKKLPDTKTYNSFASQILREMLQIDLENNKISKETFLAYLVNPNNTLGIFLSAHQTKLNTAVGYDSFWHTIHNLKTGSWTDETKLIEEYLRNFFKTAKEIGEFEKYFTPEFLKKQFYTAKIQAGENIENITKIFSETELTQMREAKKLKFVSWNKNKFELGEQIDLYLEIKNIQNFCVNIFEINTESYYRKNKAEINERINLTGLIPSKSIEHNLTTPPIISQIVEFKNLFDSKRGVYIVEFIGGGLSSRALIRIGALSLIRQVLSKGLLFHMIDEKKNICQASTTAIFVGDKLFKPDASLDHGILIPYTSKPIRETSILIHEGYAELYPLDVPAEFVSFDAGLLVNEESLISGNQVSILLMPKLFVNSKNVGLVALKKLKAEITSTNDIGINNTNNYDDLKLENGKDVVLNYLIPPKTESLTVKLIAKFNSSAQEKEIELSSSKSISVDRFRDRYVFYNYYLSQNGEEFKLHFLGKSGEPYAKQKVSITFTPVYLSNNKTETYETDENGEVHLGSLKDVSNIKVDMIDAPCTEKLQSNYNLKNDDRITTLPRSFDIVEGEDICFPLASNDFNPKEYELVRICKTNYSSVVSDHSSQLSYENGVVYLTKLTEGVYRFGYRDYQVSVTVNVHKGKRWEASQSYLVKDRSITKLLNQSLYLAYKDFKIDNRKVEFTVLSNNMGAVQVHAFAFSYFPTSIQTITSSVKALKANEGTESFELNSNSNVYLSEKNLSDEVKYVLERKRKNTFMGNTLDKPSSLLKRHFVKETQQDQEQLKQEKDYDATKKKAGNKKATMAAIYNAGTSIISYNINNLNTFLGKEGWVSYNIAPDASGKVSFELPTAECYGTLLFVIKDNKNSIVETRPLKSTQKAFRSVTLADSKKANKVYLYDRIAHKVAKDDVCEIKDLAATELSMVEDVSTLFKMLKLISTNSGLDEWDFLAKWNTLTPEEQLKKYDKYICHEFNLFAYFKDKEFFNVVVKAHIRNKSSKQMIDYFLLEDTNELKKYMNPIQLSSLNIIEQTLLLHHFKETNPEQCEAIAKSFREKISSTHFDIKEFKRLFDSVLKAQAAQESSVLGGLPMPIMANMLSNIAPMGQMMQNFSNTAPMMTQAYTTTSMAQPAYPMAMMQQQVYMPMGQERFSNNYTGPLGGMYGSGGGRGGRGGARGANFHGYAMEQRQPYQNQMESMDLLGAMNDDAGYYEQQIAYASPESSLPQIERYRTLGVTNEYIEKQYFDGSTYYGSVNKFWVDAMNHFAKKSNKPLLTENFIYATYSVTEMLLVLALIDLPFEKSTHKSESSNNQLKLTVASNCMVFSKEIQEKGDQKLDIDILISQRFCDPFDRYIHSSDGQKTLKNVTEFIVGKLYVSRVAITNSSEAQHEINIVTEIPQGSVPVISLEYMKSTNMAIDPLTTQVIEFFFYFPREGQFTCYPASINKDGCLVTTATGVNTLQVVKTRKSTEMKTISDILSQGSKSDILAFMERENLYNTDIFQFDDIYWLLDDAQFYADVLALLKRKFYFNPVVWSFSIKHGDFDTFVEYLQNYYKTNGLTLKDGEDALFMGTDLLKIDKFEFKEYNPLVNPRVHDIGEFKHNILNRDFKQTYLVFLKYLFQKTFLTAADYTYFCTYLLLQDRIDDCLTMYPLIKAEEISTDMKIQYDYLTAYLDLYNDYPKFSKARTICAEYLTYPVFTWRNRFIDLLNQISEFDGETELLEKETDETDTDKNQRQAKKEEYVSSELQGKTIKVTLKNVSNFTVKFYKIDLEIMFSQDPFLSVDKNDYSYVTPNHVIEKTLDMKVEYTTETVPIPDSLVGSNLIVQISSGALSENLTYFPTSMKVFIVKNFGQIKVTSEDSNKPLSNVYIKTFAKKTNGSITFYKDGYTDLRGTFEYTSVHSNDFADVADFSILAFSEKYGALIKQTKPPSTVAKIEVNANKVISAKMQMFQEKMVSKAKNKYCM